MYIHLQILFLVIPPTIISPCLGDNPKKQIEDREAMGGGGIIFMRKN